MLKITMDTKGAQSLLANAQKQVRFAIVGALNDAAYASKVGIETEIKRVFSQPTSWIQKSVRYKKATKEKLEAVVDFDAWGNKTAVTASMVLRAQIEGGARRLKRHEVALQKVGILPAGMAIVPGPAADKDSYGNMTGAQIVQIMSYFKAFGEQGYKANMTDKGRERLAKGSKKKGTRGFSYFAIYKKHGKLIPGIYKRFEFGAWGSAVKPVMYFVRIPKYRQLLDFYGVAERVARAEFDKRFPVRLEQALRSAS